MPIPRLPPHLSTAGAADERRVRPAALAFPVGPGVAGHIMAIVCPLSIRPLFVLRNSHDSNAEVTPV